MVGFIAVFQALENLDALLQARRIDNDALEATLQRTIFLNVLAILIERGRPDALDLTARQRGLEHVRRVHGPLSRPRPDQGVQLINKNHDILSLHDLLHDRFHAGLKLTAILRARHQRAQVESDHALVKQQLRHFFIHDALRQTFHNGGLANARLTNQNRVVLGAAA